MLLWYPGVTKTGTNSGGHWLGKHQLSKRQKEWIALELMLQRDQLPKLPVAVRFIRYSKNLMDVDNLPSSTKYLQDGIAKHYGVGDSPRDPITWTYEQRKSTEYRGVQIYIKPVPPVTG